MEGLCRCAQAYRTDRGDGDAGRFDGRAEGPFGANQVFATGMENDQQRDRERCIGRLGAVSPSITSGVSTLSGIFRGAGEAASAESGKPQGVARAADGI